MDTVNMKIYLDFEGQHKYFSNPIKVFKTNDVNSLKQQLDEIETFIKQGYYAVGYLAYESAMGLNKSNQTKNVDHDDHKLPLLLFGIFQNYLTVKPAPIINYTPPSFDLTSDTSVDEYNHKIAYLRSQIESGNTYQTNYTIRFTAPFDSNPFDYYRFLQQNNQADYCAYLHFDDYYILSISPELFFKLNGEIITTKPMKGTTARGLNNQQDKQQLELLFSEKNQAENMMIVDLLRNDLSQISKSGTISVPQLYTAEKYPTVWQLTSTIQGQLKPNLSLYQIFQALFPCGSITGAPKTSTMQIIAATENTPRGVYCGTIGCIEPFMHKAIFNIPIRTLTIHNQQMSYGVGGGITWDSTSEDEYSEIMAKTAILHRTYSIPDNLIESILLEEGQLFLLEEHLARLQDSAQFFDFQCNIAAIKLQLIKSINSYRKGSYKVRILLKKDGYYDISYVALTSSMNITQIAFAPQCVNNHDVFLYHKTSNRQHFPPLTAGKEYINFNQNNEITEFVNGNIALLIDHQWVTPAITAGLLAGTMRQFYLDHHQLQVRKIRKDEVLLAEKIAFINSVRKWVEIDNNVFSLFKQRLTE